MNSEPQATFSAIASSIGIHVLLLVLFLFWTPSLPEQQWQGTGVRPDSSRLEIKTFKQDELNRLRTVGKKDGQKDGFSAPVPQGNENRFPDEDEPVSFEPNRREELPVFDFSNLTPAEIAEPQKLPEPEKADLPPQERGIRFQQRDLSQPDDFTVRLARQQQQIQSSILREVGVSPQAQEALKRTGFNVQFEPPEGIDEDELNSIEKIFYSFQRRTFYNFVTNFLSSYQRITFSKPHVKEVLEKNQHHMIGRVEFNQDGHVVSLRIFRPSDSADVTSMFEETLKNMNLPNPPPDLLNTDRRLVIHFHLRIN
jgi:hypothetical protein